jgi:hypothetical protein
MKTDIFFVHTEKETPYNKIVFARETYFPKDEDSYTGFIIFFLVETTGGWKIYRITY